MQAATFKNIKSLQPLFDRVLVQRFKPETVSADNVYEQRDSAGVGGATSAGTWKGLRRALSRSYAVGALLSGDGARWLERQRRATCGLFPQVELQSLGELRTARSSLARLHHQAPTELPSDRR